MFIYTVGRYKRYSVTLVMLMKSVTKTRGYGLTRDHGTYTYTVIQNIMQRINLI